MKLAKMLVSVMAALFVVIVAPAQQVNDGDNAEVALRAALQQETVKGDLKGAIQQYQKILTTYPRDRSVAAKALLHIGECYEKLGQSEAHTAYQRLLRDYADQSAQANEARVRLAALGHSGPDGHEMVTRRIWSGPDVDSEGSPTPDGKVLTFVDWSTGDLAVRDLVTGAKRRLTHKGTWQESDEFAEFSVPSPDGEQVAYAWWNKDNFYELRLIGVDGSGVRTIYRNAAMDDVEPKAWMPDGKKILAGLGPKPRGRSWQIALVSVADGSVQVLKEFRHGNPGDSTFAHGCISPDGRFIAYSLPKPGDQTQSEIHLLSKDGTVDLPVVTYPAYNYFLGWAPDGTTMVFASDRTGSLGAWAVPVVDGKVQGPPKLLRPDIGGIRPLGFTRSGAFYYALKDTVRDFLTAKLDFNSGKVLTPPTPVSLELASANFYPAFSPDGNYLAYLSLRHHPRTGPAAESLADTVVIRTVGTGAERELVPKLHGFSPTPIWFPDRQSLLLWGIDGQGRRGTFQVSAQTGEASLVLAVDPKARQRYGQLTPDQKSFVYVKQPGAGDEMQIIARDLGSGTERVLLDSKQGLHGIAVSPDGQEIAFETGADAAEGAALKTMPVAGGEPRTLYSPAKPDDFNMNSLAWTPDGKRIVFGVVHGGMGGAGQNINLWETEADRGDPHMLEIRGDAIRGLQIQTDGQTIAYEAGAQSSEIGVIENLVARLTASH